MEWAYDSRTRCWRLALDGWEACVERWPASLEYLAQVVSPTPERQIIRAPHVFAQRETAQAWCLQAMTRSVGAKRYRRAAAEGVGRKVPNSWDEGVVLGGSAGRTVSDLAPSRRGDTRA